MTMQKWGAAEFKRPSTYRVCEGEDRGWGRGWWMKRVGGNDLLLEIKRLKENKNTVWFAICCLHLKMWDSHNNTPYDLLCEHKRIMALRISA